MKKLFYRIFQFVMRGAMYFLPWRKPKLYLGQTATDQMVEDLQQNGHKKVMVVTDKGVLAYGICQNLFELLNKNCVQYYVFDEVVPNPTIRNIENGVKHYNEQNCSAIIAIGGGSPIDCAKAIGARISNPHKTIRQMRGQLKVRKKLPLLIAIPTTSGTGSETTLAAVITDEKTHEKYAINDPDLIPTFAVLDPDLTVSLPPHLTATTGMDALTHAVEAYIGKSNTKETKQYAIDAIKLVFENLEKAYFDGTDIKARQNMMTAAFEAGLAFTRAYVGNVHAIAHTLGGEYGVAHGLANAIILPKVLTFYGKTIYKKIGKICNQLNLFSELTTNKEKTIAFIEKIKQLNKTFNIPDYVEQLKIKDIPKLIKRAKREANPLYPVPMIFDEKRFSMAYHSLIKIN